MALARFMALHAAIGFGIATLFVAAILAFDFNGLGHLLAPARQGVLPLGLLWLFSGLTFGSVQIGVAVMLWE
jgi:hypothetical protein